MADTIDVKCGHCGNDLGSVTFVPGRQVIGCKECGNRTRVEISKSGTVEIGPN